MAPAPARRVAYAGSSVINRTKQSHKSASLSSMSMLEKQSMQYRNLGNSGLRVSRVGLGLGQGSFRSLGVISTATSTLAEEAAEQLMTTAYEAGVNYFDTSDSQYAGKTEVVLGKVLKKKKWSAETESGLSRKHIVETVQSSLERLGLAYVDIVYAYGRDTTTPVEEIVRAFSWIIEKGYAFYWGTANWTQVEIMEAYTVAKVLNLIPPSAEQCEYNFFKREPVELVVPELLCSIGCGSITWSALAGGLISGDFDSDTLYSSNEGLPSAVVAAGIISFPERERLSSEVSSYMNKLKALRPVAEQMGCSLPQLAIAWCLRTDFVQSVLISPTSMENLRDQLIAVSVIDRLTPEILAIVEKILSNQPTLGVNALNSRNSKSSGKNSANNRRRSSTVHRKSISSSPRLSISHVAPPHEGRFGCRDSVDYSNHDRRLSHI